MENEDLQTKKKKKLCGHRVVNSAMFSQVCNPEFGDGGKWGKRGRGGQSCGTTFDRNKNICVGFI